jgi:hypothetical protein
MHIKFNAHKNNTNCNNKMVQTILLFYNGKCRWFKYIVQSV